MKEDWAYLRHIVECIEAVRRYNRGGRAAFFADRMVQKATLRELQEIAESTQRLSPNVKYEHAHIPWSDIAGFRNVLVHGYLGLNLERIWSVVEDDLAPLHELAVAILDRDPPDADR